MDGDTHVSMSLWGLTSEDLQHVFFGTLSCHSGKVAIETSETQRVLELEVPAGLVEVRIYVNDVINPS